MQESTRGNSTRDTAAGVVVLINADVQERLAINDAHYKLRHIVEEVGGDIDKSLPLPCEQLKTRQTKEEMKSSIRALLRIVCSRILGDFNEFTSMCEEHIPSPVENAKQKDDGTPKTDRHEDMMGYDQDRRQVVNIIKQYIIEGTACFHVLGRAMSDTLHAGQELRHVVEEVVGDMDKSLSMLCEQLGTRLTKDEMKPDIRYLLRFVCSRFLGDLNGFSSMCEEHILRECQAEG